MNTTNNDFHMKEHAGAQKHNTPRWSSSKPLKNEAHKKQSQDKWQKNNTSQETNVFVTSTNLLHTLKQASQEFKNAPNIAPSSKYLNPSWQYPHICLHNHSSHEQSIEAQ